MPCSWKRLCRFQDCLACTVSKYGLLAALELRGNTERSLARQSLRNLLTRINRAEMRPCSSAKVVLSKVYQGMTDKGEWNVCLVELFFPQVVCSIHMYQKERVSFVFLVQLEMMLNVQWWEISSNRSYCLVPFHADIEKKIPVIFPKMNVCCVTA